MSGDLVWYGTDDSALSWLRGVATDSRDTGYNVGPMPDKVFVLYPLFERRDGKPIDDRRRTDHPVRRVRWDTYAQRRNIPMLLPGGWPGWKSGLPGLSDDDCVYGPDEGVIGDPDTRRALFDILIRHSDGGPDAMCTAYYWSFFVGGPRPPDMPQPPNVLRGPLHAWNELFDRPEYGLSPQNLWPDDHQWVLETDVDSWATEISGSTQLIEDIIASPHLEAIRLPHLH
jgi:hypothetical protein